MGTEFGNENYNEPEDLNKEQIRCLVSSIYDLQKVRIAIGNRVVASFYISLGIKPGEKKAIKKDSEKCAEEEDKERKKTLLKLRKEYRRVADYVSENKSSIRAAIKKINSGEEGLQWIRSESDYRLIDSYNQILSAEEEEIKVLTPYVEAHPMWNAFFKDVKGCGVLMSAVCIAYLNPRKARHVSSFYKYAGLDAVNDTDEFGNAVYWNESRTRKLREKVMYVTEFGDSYTREEVTPVSSEDADGNEIFLTKKGEVCTKELVMTTNADGEDVQVYEDIKTGEEYVGDVMIAQHGRRKGDTEMYEYVSKTGETKLKRGITYNPALKEKLMGVLAGCLLKAKNPKYATIYYNYRARLDSSPSHSEKRAKHKFLMAERYMIKQFLRDMWVTWRELEGLPVDLPYEVDKLGHEPHALNSYQCEVARRSIGLTSMIDGDAE